MKIMHLISGGDVGGAKTHVISLLEELSKRNEVELVCFVDGPFAEEAREKGIQTTILRKANLPTQCKRIKKYLRVKNFDLLHCHGAKANVASMLMGRNMPVPVISTVHSDPRLDYMSRPAANMTIGVLNRLALRRRDGWVAVSDEMKNRITLRGYDADRIWPIYNGISFPEKMPHRSRGEYLQAMGLDWNEEHVIFGIAARIDPVKDMTTLVRAFAQAVQQAPSARLLIAGDGDQRAEIEALAAELCPAGTVHFAGWQSDMNSFYHAVDVNMLTSISETFPYAITEGARMYCCTIATAVGGVPKVVIDGETGFLIDVGDHETMGRRMVQVALDGKLRTTLGGAIREKVRTEFSVEAMAARQEEIYRSVLSRHHRAGQGRDGAVICGAYGKGNAGDDAILVSIIGQLRRQDPDLPICVMSRTPKETAAMTGVSSVHIFDVFAVNRRMKKSKLYISGGGSLIQNITSTRSLLFYLFSICQAKKAGCKVMMYGCGIGPVLDERNQRRTSRVLNEYVDLITLRENDSREILASFGVDQSRIRVTADPALTTRGDAAEAERFLLRSGLEPEGNYAMFVLRPWDGVEQKLGDICRGADYLWETRGLRPVLCMLEPNRDRQISERAASMMKAPAVVLPPVSDGGLLCGVIGKMELVVSMRLHALIFACGQQTPIAAISYDPKVTSFMHSLDAGCCVELADLDEQKLKQTVERALEQRIPREKLLELQAKAEENGILAGELLRN